MLKLKLWINKIMILYCYRISNYLTKYRAKSVGVSCLFCPISELVRSWKWPVVLVVRKGCSSHTQKAGGQVCQPGSERCHQAQSNERLRYFTYWFTVALITSASCLLCPCPLLNTYEIEILSKGSFIHITMSISWCPSSLSINEGLGYTDALRACGKSFDFGKTKKHRDWPMRVIK